MAERATKGGGRVYWYRFGGGGQGRGLASCPSIVLSLQHWPGTMEPPTALPTPCLAPTRVPPIGMWRAIVGGLRRDELFCPDRVPVIQANWGSLVPCTGSLGPRLRQDSCTDSCLENMFAKRVEKVIDRSKQKKSN